MNATRDSAPYAEEFVQGKLYRRSDLHKLYGGQRQGGISTPSKHNFIFLFTSESGEALGYSHRWSEDGIFYYAGEGQQGDMKFERRNLAVWEHAKDGKDLHLFRHERKGFVRYVGQMVCSGYHTRRLPGREGKSRQAIIFELTPLGEFESAHRMELPGLGRKEILAGQSLEELRKRALSDAAKARTSAERKAATRVRSEAIRWYILKRSEGKCESCGEPAPFKKPDGTPYLECHHIRRLSDGGPDDPTWVAALCANCHRRAHESEDARQYNRRLTDIVHRIERELGFV